MRTLNFVIGALLPLMASAQSTLQVSNLGETPTSSATIGSDAWIAQRFYIVSSDTNTYTLDSVQLLLTPASGDPNGFAVSIYQGTGIPGDGPQTELATLTGSDDPASGGTLAYSASGLTLSSASDYYVVVSAATPIVQGSYSWSAVDPASFRTMSWTIQDVYFSSSNGSSWMLHAREKTFQLALYATLVPEPSTAALLGLGLAGLCLWRGRPPYSSKSQCRTAAFSFSESCAPETGETANSAYRVLQSINNRRCQ